jgi:hypothetical protein
MTEELKPEEFTAVFTAFKESPEGLVRAILRAGGLRRFGLASSSTPPGTTVRR